MKYHNSFEAYAATKVAVIFNGKQIGHWYTLPNGECRYFSNKLYVNPFRKSA